MKNARPTPTIDRPNQVDALRDHLETTLPQFESLPGVVGVTLNGGLARGYGDDLSEIDVTLYLTDDHHDAWMAGRAPIATGITVVDGHLYDIAIERIEAFESGDWSETERWDRSYAEVLFDPDERLADAFEQHLGSPPGLDRAEGLLFDCWWHFELTAGCWIHRGDAVQAHYVLDAAVEPLIKALFAVNDAYLPHDKWLVNLSRSLEWHPDAWETRLQSALASGTGSMDAVTDRRAVIESLWDDIDRYAHGKADEDVPVRMMQRTFYRALARLVDEQRVPYDEWDETFGARLLAMDPFAAVAQVEDDAVSLNADALADLTADEMYDWHYQVVDAVRQRD
ncbi:DUF4037 domain-containing protein [Haloferax sp. MBLA0076]|uniref:DUF4037 domain-containing protein n=1 Tax=Haloferax litoreum TaxID=2666140 RepID=A0A6A8GL07_9EURY|nr:MULTISPECIES: DUF4037 domain-containing protein [Haloferax]KAB1189983.1 DUF4037 domain-containing protein [Haloferax sp. CBA1148]MRX23756.1 DUF4037 domain-containing protein [Haloferax litoreum]